MALKNRVAVLMRQLPRHIAVVSTVIALAEDMDIDTHLNEDHYDGWLRARAEESRERFIAAFPEFRTAVWEITILTMDKAFFGPRN